MTTQEQPQSNWSQVGSETLYVVAYIHRCICTYPFLHRYIYMYICTCVHMHANRT